MRAHTGAGQANIGARQVNTGEVHAYIIGVVQLYTGSMQLCMHHADINYVRDFTQG